MSLKLNIFGRGLVGDFSVELRVGQVWIDEYYNELKIISVNGSEVKLIMSDGFIVTRDALYIKSVWKYKGDFNE